MADVGNMLANYGTRPSILERVEEQRANRVGRQMNEFRLQSSLEERDRQNQIRQLAPNALAGDPAALSGIAGRDPALALRLKDALMRMDEVTLQRADQEATGLAATIIQYKDNPALLQQATGLTPEQIPETMAKLAQYSGVRKEIEAARRRNMPANIQRDDSGRAFGITQTGPFGGNVQQQQLAGDQMYKRPPTAGGAGGPGRGWKVNTRRYIAADGTRYLQTDDGTGNLKYYKEQTGEEVPYMPEDAVAEYVESNRVSAKPGQYQRIYRETIARAKPITDIGHTLDQLETVIQSGNPVSTSDIRRLLASVSIGNAVRAVADLNLSSNPGTLWQRFTGNISKMLTGEFTNVQTHKLMLPYIEEMRTNFLYPTLQELEQEAQRRASTMQDPGAAVPRFDIPREQGAPPPPPPPPSDQVIDWNDLK